MTTAAIETEFALTVTQGLTVTALFTENKMDPLIAEIVKEVRSFQPDISTAKGRKEIASLAHKVAKSKTYLDDLGKDLVSEWKDKSKKVDEVRKKMRDDLDKLKDEARKPLTEFEEKEDNRLKTHEANILIIESFKVNSGASHSSEEIQAALASLELIEINDSWDEFRSKAEMKKKESFNYLQGLLSTRLQYEAEQAELKKLREENEARLKKEHEEKIAREASEKAKKEAEEKALSEKLKIENEKQQAILKQKEAEQKEALAKQALIDSEKRAKEAADKAERDKKEAEARATETERLRQENLKKLEAEAQAKREANIRHCKKVNNEALNSLVAEAGIDPDTAKKVVEAIARQKVTHITISY